MKRINNRLALVLCLILGVTACSSEKTSEDYLTAAKANINASKNADAIIALKNAVRVDLKNAEARALLGSVYLNMGEAEAAEKELKRALELSGNIDNTLPKLLKAFNLQRKNDEIIAFTSELEQLTPEILLYQALAYNRLGEKEKTKQSVVRANELSAESIYSQLGNAYLKAGSSDIDGALENTKKILAEAPNLTEALLLKGQLSFVNKDYTSALNAFNEYHQLLQSDVQIRLFLAHTYIKNEQFDEANKHVSFLLQLVPEHPFTNQLKGLIFYQKSDYKQALFHTEKAIQNGLDTAANRVVAGLSAFKLEQYELAHQYLITLAEGLRPTHSVSRVLALIQIQLGYSVDAGSTLSELEGLTSQDINLITTASFELLKAGKIEDAKTLLEKTKEVDINSAEEIAKVGILKLSLDDLEGLADLEKAVEIDPELPIAKMALAAAYIQSKEYDKALDLAEQWKHANPEQVEGYNLAAKVLFIQNQIDKAEQELKQALRINKYNNYSLLYFANQSIENQAPTEALKHLENIFSVSPDHVTALKLNYRAHKMLATETLALLKIEQSFKNNQGNLAYRLLYAKVLFIEKDFNKTIELLENLKNKGNTPLIQRLLLADSYLKLNKNGQAVAVYDDWIKAQPMSRAALLHKVSIQERIADYSGALLTVEKLLLTDPKDGQLNVLRANYLILTNNLGEAKIQIESLSEEQQKLPLVKGLQGIIWLTEGKYKQALPSLEGLYALKSNSYYATLLFSTYTKLGHEKVAFDFIQKHVNSFPEDKASRDLLAQSAVVYNPELAKKNYLVLLETSPNSLSILNNLAWVNYLLANYTEADNFADRALKVNPLHPQVLDTAGLIQLKLGNKEQAIKLLNKAKRLAPKDKKISKHYEEAITQ
jgi:putative PEP-CTERM system TPR-repeat lipoprotein